MIFVSDEPEISSASDTCHETIQEARDITLHCIAQSLPAPTINWFHPNGSQITSPVNETTISNDTFLGITLQSDMTISITNISDYIGNFTCNASNSVDTKSLGFDVTDMCPSKYHSNFNYPNYP